MPLQNYPETCFLGESKSSQVGASEVAEVNALAPKPDALSLNLHGKKKKKKRTNSWELAVTSTCMSCAMHTMPCHATPTHANK